MMLGCLSFINYANLLGFNDSYPDDPVVLVGMNFMSIILATCPYHAINLVYIIFPSFLGLMIGCNSKVEELTIWSKVHDFG